MFTNHHGEVDLVVSDVVMPEMDGPTLMQHLRRERPDLKIIFISGYAEDAFRQQPRREGGLHVLAEALRSEGARRRGEGRATGLTPASLARLEPGKSLPFGRRSRLHALTKYPLAAFGAFSARAGLRKRARRRKQARFRRRRRAKPRMPALTIERYGGRLIYFWFGMRFGALMKLFKRGHYNFTLNCHPRHAAAVPVGAVELGALLASPKPNTAASPRASARSAADLRHRPLAHRHDAACTTCSRSIRTLPIPPPMSASSRTISS